MTDTLSTSQSGKPKSRKSWLLALLVSLLLNAFMAGLLTSKFSNRHHAKMPKPSYMINGVIHPRMILQSLPKQRRRALMKQALTSADDLNKDDIRQLFKDINKTRTQLLTDIGQTPLNPQDISRGLAEIRDDNAKISASGDALLVKILSQMTPEERANAIANIKAEKRGRQSPRNHKAQRDRPARENRH